MEFPGVLALDQVSFGIRQGSVHVMMGENGAGKSTLMKILNGTHVPTSGKFYIDEREMKFQTTLNAEKQGVSMIYQELNYIPDMSVERYLMLCREPKKGPFIDWKGVHKEAKKILEEENLNYDPKITLRNLSVSDIQLLEITREIKRNQVEILIMDEPTSALTNAEVERLFRDIKALKERGITIIYISHKMDEIFRIADDITVMRDGKHIHTGPASEFTQDSLVKMMVGREITNVYPKEKIPLGETLLEVEGLNSEFSKLSDINFKVHAGEIVGLGGLMGAGRTETVRAICGLDPYESGKIRIQGKEVRIKSVTEAIKHGIVMASEDRRRYGLILCRDIRENISLSSLKRITKKGFLQIGRERKLTREYFDELKIKAPGMGTATLTLSGGNQQKVVLGKCLMTQAKVLILDEPTRGIDVGAKYEIYKLITELAKQGIGIIFISSELPEFIGMCDTAYVMYKGKIIDQISRDKMTQENIVMLAAGGKIDG
ncbi:MAG: sugar ABC transporter ATP-binding protein [Lachnospiraceae bacterium]|nr:sugar ABC transporter ATP-binding protein [Lachnospiraceae bacterium]